MEVSEFLACVVDEERAGLTQSSSSGVAQEPQASPRSPGAGTPGSSRPWSRLLRLLPRAGTEQAQVLCREPANLPSRHPGPCARGGSSFLRWRWGIPGPGRESAPTPAGRRPVGRAHKAAGARLDGAPAAPLGCSAARLLRPRALWLLPLLLLCPAPSRASPERSGSAAETCLLRRDPGPCQDPVTRYFYDRRRQLCRPFQYGGCGGNANNFASLEACEEACWMIEEVPKYCRFEVSKDKCGRSSKEYFFNLKTMRCEKFLSGGCSQYRNRFPDEASCMNFCASKKMPSFCYSPKDGGLCFANETRFYFNMRYKTCEAFTYTGCGGNDNNFSYLKDCQRVCEKAYKMGKRKKQIPPFTIIRPKNWKKVL
ncbi:tissue factor pathway inhibitor 2 [Octodon degus]|uniref:Tissue factor pathway inhibitor 2 n=1 Tax=Octodon degus TaxID=10160 RepID=A0A6P6DQP6_OCTDE|nr:tissue factor pathway inhibitor 2 [Octodon degus]